MVYCCRFYWAKVFISRVRFEWIAMIWICRSGETVISLEWISWIWIYFDNVNRQWETATSTSKFAGKSSWKEDCSILIGEGRKELSSGQTTIVDLKELSQPTSTESNYIVVLILQNKKYSQKMMYNSSRIRLIGRFVRGDEAIWNDCELIHLHLDSNQPSKIVEMNWNAKRVDQNKQIPTQLHQIDSCLHPTRKVRILNSIRTVENL